MKKKDPRHLPPEKPRRGYRWRWGAGVLVGILLVALGSAAMLAYYVHRSAQMANALTPVAVSCEVEEAFSNNTKTAIQVKNTSDVAAYIRVKLVSYWETPSGVIAGRTGSGPDIAFTPNNGWKSVGENTYIYTQPVEAGASTPDLLQTDITLAKDADGYIPVVKVLAEAIQAAPATAVTEAWKVTVEADGTIS